MKNYPARKCAAPSCSRIWYAEPDGMLTCPQCRRPLNGVNTPRMGGESQARLHHADYTAIKAMRPSARKGRGC